MVKTLLKNSAGILFRKQTSILSAAGVIGITYFLSAILGLLRDRLLAGRFPPHTLGIYWAADRLPSFIFNLVVIGALSSSFIPVFTRVLNREGKESSFKTASIVINTTLLVFLIIALVFIVFASPLARLLAPAGSAAADIAILADLLKLLLIAQLFLLLSNFVTSLLQSYQRFLLPALAPVIYNLGVVTGILFLSSTFGIYAAAIGTIIGGVFHLLIQLPLIPVLGIKYSFSFDVNYSGVKDIWKLTVPRLFGIGAIQIQALVDTVLAASLSFSSVTYFTFAQHLQNLPVSLFGAAVAQAALPVFSHAAEENNKEKLRSQFLTALRQVSFLLVPASVLLIILRLPAVRLAFGAAKFDWMATLATGYVLAFFALSFLPQALVLLLARGFYALHDTVTPVRAGIISVTANIILSLSLIRIFSLDVWSLALSFSFSSFLNCVLLLHPFLKKIGGIKYADIVAPIIKISIAGIFMAASIYLPLKILDRGAWGKHISILPFSLPANFDILILDTRYTMNLILLSIVSATSGVFFYLLAAYFLRIQEFMILFGVVRKRIKDTVLAVNRLLSSTLPV